MARTLVYVLLIGGLFSFAGLAVETLLSLARRPQRVTWVISLVLSLVVPFGATYLVERSSALDSYQELTLPQWPDRVSFRATLSPTNTPPAATASSASPAGTVPLSRADSVNEPAGLSGRLEPFALIAWLLSSIAMLGTIACSTAVLGRKLRALESATLWGAMVRVSDSLGPAVLGLRTAQIVVPRWLLTASASIQKAAIAHETEHVRSHDARLLLAGVVLVALMPWNPVLWWQLSRLRFAIEKDCDRRVIALGFDAADYSRALIAVAKLHLATYFGAVALGERATLLEKRIHRLLRPTIRHRLAWGAGALFALLSCLAIAVEVRPPDTEPPAWPSTPDESPFYAKALSAARQRYPELFAGQFAGTVEIHVELSLDGSVTSTRTYSFPAGPIDYSSLGRDVNWSNLLRWVEEGYGAPGTFNTHLLGWYGPTRRNGLYLSYGVYRWQQDAERSPVRALQLVNAVHPDFIQGTCYRASPTRTPRTLTVLFSDGGAITKESWSDTPVTNGVSKEMPIITASTLAAEHFQSLGYDTSQLAHWGRVPTYLHGFPTGCLVPAGWLYYAWPRRPTDPIVDFKAERPILKPLITANGREIDGNKKRAQRLFEYYFRDVWWGGPTSEGQFELLLLDRDGRVIAQEQGSRPAVDPFKAVYNVAGHRYRVFIATPVTCRSQKQVDLVVARTIEDDQM